MNQRLYQVLTMDWAFQLLISQTGQNNRTVHELGYFRYDAQHMQCIQGQVSKDEGRGLRPWAGFIAMQEPPQNV